MKISEIMVSKGLVTVKTNETVGGVLARMRETGVHQVPVLSGKRYLGMLSYREILRRRSIFPGSKVESVMIKTPRLAPTDDLYAAIKLFKETGLSALPVVEKGMLTGIVSRTNILKNISSVLRPGQIIVSEIMTDDPVLAGEEESLDQAMEKVREIDESEIPVVDSGRKLVGMLMVNQLGSDALLQGKEKHSRRDLLANTEKLGVKAGSLMSPPYSVKSSASLDEAARTLVEQHAHVIPVVDDAERVTGILDVFDVINAIESSRRKGGVFIQVSGLEEYDDDLYDIIYFEAGKFLSRIAKLSEMRNGAFNVHVTKYRSEGRTKFSVRTKLFGGGLSMSVSDHDWNFGKCVSRIFETYENRLKRWRERQ